MANLERLREERGYVRMKATKRIQALTGALPDSILTANVIDIKAKLSHAMEAMTEQENCHEKCMRAMHDAKANKDDIKTDEAKNTKWVDANMNDINRAEKMLIQVQIHKESLRVTTDAKLWYTCSSVKSATFDKQGTARKDELLSILEKLEPYKKVEPLATQARLVDSLLENVTAKLYASEIEDPIPAASSSVAEPKKSLGAPPPYKVVLPRFSGKAKEFHVFKQRFSDIMTKHDDYYSDSDKLNILAEAMDDKKAKDVVISCYSAGYDVAMEELQLQFGRKCVIYPLLVDELLSRKIIDYTADGMKEAEASTKKLMEEFEKLEAKDMELLSVALAIRRFDDKTRDEWTRFLGQDDDDDLPTMAKLLEFVSPRARKLPNRHYTAAASNYGSKWKSSSASSTPKKSCPICTDGSHPAFRCKRFKEADVKQRTSWAKQHKLCNICLHSNHATVDCTNTYKCRHCDGRHNYLLHTDEEKKKSGASLATTGGSITKAGFIMTALVKLQNGYRSMPARAALDMCSTHTFISETMVQSLKLDRKAESLTVSGAVSRDNVTHACKVEIATLFPSDVAAVEVGAAITPKVISSSPPPNVEEILALPEFDKCVFADQHLGGRIDIIIGTQDLHHFMQHQIKFNDKYSVTAMKSVFGWALHGPSLTDKAITLTTSVSDISDSQLFKQLYMLEQVPTASTLTQEEKSAIKQFENSIERHSDGRYSCVLPRVDNPPKLGESKMMARARFLANEKNMVKKGAKAAFDDELQTYIDLGHAQFVPEDEEDIPDAVYLPVHGVVKPSSTSTKVRPVFDGSARTSTQHCVNDLFLTGPSLNPLTSDLLVRFRTRRVGLTADVGKMYREVRLCRRDQELHRFFIRDKEGRIKSARMLRLTFGIKPSPFVAISVLRHHARAFADDFPEASREILQSFYVDDFVSGADDVASARMLRRSLTDLLAMAGMQLRKWRSSSAAVLEDVAEELKEKDNETRGNALKALGIRWDTKADMLLISMPDISAAAMPTKRVVARLVAGVFDVLGLIAPWLVVGKILLQKLWAMEVGWDQDIPESLLPTWKAWCGEFEAASQLQIPRFAQEVFPTSVLCGFADSSTEAYAAVIYVKSGCETALLTSRARVCPLKQRTIPEMELEAARLLAQLMAHTAEVLNLPVDSCHCWTDSKIVLAWLCKPLHTLKVFVANRVAAINDLVPDACWKHVSTHDNPADLPSRGTTLQELKTSNLWWHGPEWLKQPAETWQGTVVDLADEDLPGIKKQQVVCFIASSSEWSLWSKFSDYHKLVRVLAWILRFVSCCKTKQKGTRILSFEEWQAAKIVTLKHQQVQVFKDEIHALKANQYMPKSSKLCGLQTTMDKGIIVVRGRASTRKLIPLAATEPITRIMIATFHRECGHAGTATVMSILGHQHLIFGIKKLLKKISRHCVVCRQHSKSCTPAMGLLPSCRTEIAPPFTTTGVDMAGPVTLREGATRKPVLYKAYICIFVCMATRAVHLELCRSLSSEEFAAVFGRFCSRRGTPSVMMSDNGSNFVASADEIKQATRMMKKTSDRTADIKWVFNPPKAPNFGGLWEAGVKAAKRLMVKMMASHPMRFDELYTVITSVEALLNSRPMMPLEEIEVDDELMLTPGHFLIRRPIRAPPLQQHSNAKIGTLRRWQLTKRLAHDLEQAWKAHYLQTLQRQSKWLKKTEAIKEGDIVYVQDADLVKNKRWPLAKVTKVYPGKDGQVRVVDVKCAGKTYRRATSMLVHVFSSSKAAPQDVQGTEQREDVRKAAINQSDGSHEQK